VRGARIIPLLRFTKRNDGGEQVALWLQVSDKDELLLQSTALKLDGYVSISDLKRAIREAEAEAKKQ